MIRSTLWLLLVALLLCVASNVNANTVDEVQNTRRYLESLKQLRARRFNIKTEHDTAFVAVEYGESNDDWLLLTRREKAQLDRLIGHELDALAGKSRKLARTTIFEIERPSSLRGVRIEQSRRSTRRASDYPTTPAFIGKVEELLNELDKDNLHETMDTLQAYRTRYATTSFGHQASEWLQTTASFLIENNDDLNIEVVADRTGMNSTVVRLVPYGYENEPRVILGSHLDSYSSAIAPGADDNASGVAVCLEVLRTILVKGTAFDWRRPVEFHFYSGEEIGLLGSKYVVNEYVANDIEVAAMLQLDMVAYQNFRYDPVPKIGVIFDSYTSTPLSEFVLLMSNQYSAIGGGRTQCGYGCSDHASWERQGYPATYVTENLSLENDYYHTPSDLLQYLNMTHCLEIAKMCAGFVVELGLSSNHLRREVAAVEQTTSTTTFVTTEEPTWSSLPTDEYESHFTLTTTDACRYVDIDNNVYIDLAGMTHHRDETYDSFREEDYFTIDGTGNKYYLNVCANTVSTDVCDGEAAACQVTPQGAQHNLGSHMSDEIELAIDSAKQPVVILTYTDGEMCAGNKPRTSKVHIHCRDELDDYLVEEANEIDRCEYEFHLYSWYACPVNFVDDTCIFETPLGFVFDASQLEHHKNMHQLDWHATDDKGHNYYFNLCSPVVNRECQNIVTDTIGAVPACQVDSIGQAHALGSSDSMVVMDLFDEWSTVVSEDEAKGFVLIYSDGQVCNGGQARAVKIIVECAPGIELMEVVSVIEVERCVYHINVLSQYGCAIARYFETPSGSSDSGSETTRSISSK